MYTIAETAQFISQVSDIWTDDERLNFFEFLAQNPKKVMLSPMQTACVKYFIQPKDTASVVELELSITICLMMG